MHWNEAERRIVAGRDDRTEFVDSFDDPSTVGRTICAFANTEGGVLVLGAKEYGEIVGIEDDPVEVGGWLDDLLDTGFTTPIPATRSRHRCGAGWVHWIATPSLRFIGGVEFDNRFRMRNASTTMEPPQAEVRDLLRDALFPGEGPHLLRGVRPEGLGTEAIRTFRSRSVWLNRTTPRRSLERAFEFVGATVSQRGQRHVSLAGLLAFGRSPQAFRQTRDFAVRCTAYWSRERDWNIVFPSEVGGRLDEQVRGALRCFDRLGWRALYGGCYHGRSRILPSTILWEALASAVAHRDYALSDRSVRLEVFEDRVEVTSPRTLPDHTSLQGLYRGVQRVRNLLAFEALCVAGTTISLGWSMPRMRCAMRAFNGKTLGFESDRFRLMLRLCEEENCQ